MSRKKKQSGDQMMFQFSVSKADLMSLEGGSQEQLSEFEFRFRQVLKETLDRVASRAADPLDRIEVAARMSRLLGREITKSNIDQWTAMATVQRRMHVDSLKAFCEVTGDMRPLTFLVESCGMKALSPDMAVCAEYGAKLLFKKGLENKIKETLDGVDEQALFQRLVKRFTGGEE